MNLFLVCFIAGASFLLSFLLFFHPLKQNITANRWLSLSVFIIGSAFIGSYLLKTEATVSNNFLFKCLNSLQFLLAPSFYISILYFVKPTKVFQNIDWLHFIPFAIFLGIENIWMFGRESISTYTVFEINKDLPFIVRDVLPLLSFVYLLKSYHVLVKHKNNLKLISSSIDHINLDWLVQFLFILSITIFIWMNDALFGLPYLTEATNFVYAVCIFFLAYFSIKQKTIFAFTGTEIQEISDVFENNGYSIDTKKTSGLFESANTSQGAIATLMVVDEKPKLQRLNADQLASLSSQLASVMEKDKLFLDNELNLPTVAEKLRISIHEASFLINETTKDNFYNFVNRYRVEEAKKLLASSTMDELNILGIAFASGFNSKTTFNTTFKRIVGISPSQYSREQKK
jgi:AraC-like DNA-binding protein